MPELPEIEHLRRTLQPRLVRAVVTGVELRQADVVRGGCGRGATVLLRGSRIIELRRCGKNLAIIADTGRTLCVHLGMSGQLFIAEPSRKLDDQKHVHCIWRLGTPRGRARLVFRDPRRFGGLWPFASVSELLRERWSVLGPDALTIDAAALARQLNGSKRPIKAALLDQAVIAGVGNIYADESLFLAGIHPMVPTHRLDKTQLAKLAEAIRKVLAAAVDAGGSTIRSYIDGNGHVGGYASRHLVYGRAGEPCPRCGKTLTKSTVAQRTTVFCPKCQRLKGFTQS